MQRRCWILFLGLLSLAGAGCVSVVQTHQETIVTPDYQSWSQGLDAQRGIVRLSGRVDEFSAQDLTRKLLILDEAETPERISIYINSNGGETNGYRAILNAMRESSKPVDVIVVGNCYSAACAILQCATGRRRAYANAHFMVHAPAMDSGGCGGFEQALAFERRLYDEILRQRSQLPQDWFPLGRKMRFFTSQEALTYGFIDEVVEPSNGDA